MDESLWSRCGSDERWKREEEDATCIALLQPVAQSRDLHRFDDTKRERMVENRREDKRLGERKRGHGRRDCLDLHVNEALVKQKTSKPAPDRSPRASCGDRRNRSP